MGEIGLFAGIVDETGLVVGIGPVVGIGLFGGTLKSTQCRKFQNHGAKKRLTKLIEIKRNVAFIMTS